MSLIDQKNCKRCRFYGPQSRTCDFYLKTWVRRGCPAGKGCTRFEKSKKERGELKPKRHRRRKFNELEAWKLYELERLNDRDIGKRLGVSWGAILDWRKEHHYPCNYKAGGQRLADRPATKPPEIQGANT